MKTIGLLGGMSWESSALYYRWINELVREELGGLHSAKIAMVSVDFQEIEDLQHKGEWEQSGELLSQSAMQIEAAINIPLLHIADATAEAIKAAGIKIIGLLGTNFTMEQEFYAGRLRKKHGLTVLTPPKADRDIVHRIIYEELVVGVVRDESRAEYLRIMDDLQQQGAEGVIEGCTEIVMLVQQKHTSIPLFDTTAIHAKAAVGMALAE